MSAVDLTCLTCGTDNEQRECPDWCPAMQGACGCGEPLCGECMRSRHDGAAPVRGRS